MGSDAVKTDKHGIQWTTEGYMKSMVVIAKENERDAILEWIDEQIKICDLQVYHEKPENVKSLWYARKNAFDVVVRHIRSRSPLHAPLPVGNEGEEACQNCVKYRGFRAHNPICVHCSRFYEDKYKVSEPKHRKGGVGIDEPKANDD